MFSPEERDLLKISRAMITLHGFFIVDEDYNIIDSPLVMVNLLTKPELESFQALASLTPEERYKVEDSMLENCVLTVIGNTRKILWDYSPAGVSSSISRAIILLSEFYLKNESNNAYVEAASGVNYLETMCAIISYYMNVTYDYAVSLPVNEIYKRYAICQQAFPNQVQPISVEEE